MSVPISCFLLLFQLTRLMRGVTPCEYYCTVVLNISTHTPHARRDAYETPPFKCIIISTHTPHARRDIVTSAAPTTSHISTHTPHARRDGAISFPKKRKPLFQLTRLMRGVTHVGRIIGFFTIFQLTRLMRGVTSGLTSLA